MYLPFLGKETLAVKKKLQKFFSSQFPAFELKVILKSDLKIGNLLDFKDILPFSLRSFVIINTRAVITI